jgi:hypothetical protein
MALLLALIISVLLGFSLGGASQSGTSTGLQAQPAPRVQPAPKVRRDPCIGAMAGKGSKRPIPKGCLPADQRAALPNRIP